MTALTSLPLEEPELRFGFDQTAQHPKDGLFFYGPVEQHAVQEMRLGVVGSRDGINRLERWIARASSFVGAFNDRPHHSPFPGFEAAFRIRWPNALAAKIELPDGELERRIRYDDPFRAVYDSVDLIVTALEKYERKSDVAPTIWFVVLPEDVSRYGRPLSKVPREERVFTPNKLGKATADRLASSHVLFEDLEKGRKPYQYERDFHNQLKARLLERGMVTQIVRETTLAPEDFLRNGRPTRTLQDQATTLWNLTTSLYYKAAGAPWRLANVREHVCYVGLVFKVDSNRPKEQRVCCGAQMFLATGEGVVFRGHLGPWQSERPGEVHLDKQSAKELIREVVDAYRDEHGCPPKEVFLHGKTRFTRPEWDGFEEGATGVAALTAVQIQKTNEIKVYRDRNTESPGVLPVVRGSAVRVSQRDAYLWTNGYVPRLGTYAGWEVPSPLKVSVHRGDGKLETVLSDVLGLTKLNFNACIFGDGLPVTLRFADSVGEILTAGPIDRKLKPLPFKHYI